MTRTMMLTVPTLLAVGLATTAPAQEPRPRRVEVARVERVDLERRIPLVGRLRPYSRALLVPRVTGYLAEISVEPGDVVERGAVLARLAVPDVDAELVAAEAMLAEAAAGREDAAARVERMRARAQVAESEVALARAGLEVRRAELRMEELSLARMKQLVEGRAASAEQLEQAESEHAMARAQADSAEASVAVSEAMRNAARSEIQAAEAGQRSADARVRTAEAALESARVRLSFSELRNPYERGLVTRRAVDLGALIEAGETEVLELMDVARLRATFDVPERDAPLMKPGTPVTLHIAALGAQAIEAELTRTHGVVDPMTGTVRAEVELENDGRLMPGMFCQLEVLAVSSPGALVVPGGAIYADGKSTWVLVERDGKAQRVAVTLGYDDGLRSEVLEGLTGDERVVLGHPPGLHDGDRFEGVLQEARR